MDEVDIATIYSEFAAANPRFHEMYLRVVSNSKPNPKIQFELIPRLTEDFSEFTNKYCRPLVTPLTANLLTTYR